MHVISENITADDGSKIIQSGLVSRYWTIVFQKCENEYPVKLFKLFWTYNHRVSCNTQSWQCWYFCITPNENQMEINDSWIKFNIKWNLSWCIELKLMPLIKGNNLFLDLSYTKMPTFPTLCTTGNPSGVLFLPEVYYILHGNDENKDARIPGVPSFIPAEQWS